MLEVTRIPRRKPTGQAKLALLNPSYISCFFASPLVALNLIRKYFYMIELIGINKTYPNATSGVKALININLQVAAGEIVGVIGKSGAGKSTLIRCINLLERPSSGIVRVANEELTVMSTKQLRAARQHIGMIFPTF